MGRYPALVYECNTCGVCFHENLGGMGVGASGLVPADQGGLADIPEGWWQVEDHDSLWVFCSGNCLLSFAEQQVEDVGKVEG